MFGIIDSTNRENGVTNMADTNGRLAGKVCIVTGGARGQGAAEARLFTQEGGKVWITDVLDDEGEALAKEIGANYRNHDVRDEDQWGSLIDAVMSTDGALNVLINNA